MILFCCASELGPPRICSFNFFINWLQSMVFVAVFSSTTTKNCQFFFYPLFLSSRIHNHTALLGKLMHLLFCTMTIKLYSSSELLLKVVWSNLHFMTSICALHLHERATLPPPPTHTHIHTRTHAHIGPHTRAHTHAHTHAYLNPLLTVR